MRKSFAVIAVIGLAACGGGSSVTNPTSNTPVEPVAVGSTPVASQPIVAPPASSPVDAWVNSNGTYHAKNETGISQYYCAASFGVLPGGEQGAGTNLEHADAIIANNDVFEGRFEVKAACQYKQIQIDLTQQEKCWNFNWSTILGAKIIDNPNFIDGAAFDQLEDEITWLYSEGQNSENWCGSRTRIVWSVKKFKCSGQIVKTEKSRTVEEKPCCNDEFRAAISGPTFPTYHAAQPATYYYYWDMDNGNGDGPKQNACEGRGGTWLGDNYNIPDDGSNNSYNDVCRFTTGPSIPGGPGADADFIKSVQHTAAVSASGGNPISGSATFYNSGSWEVRLLATSSVSEYNSNNPDYVKDTAQASLSCGGQTSKSVSYSWVGHDSEYWWIEVRRNGSFFSKSGYVINPTN